MTCLGYKFHAGEEHVQSGKLKICGNGFHFCENPADVLDYRHITTSEFAAVEAIGEVVTGVLSRAHYVSR